MVTGRNVLGNLTVGINAPIGPLKSNLTQAENATIQSSGKMSGAMDNFGESVSGAAGEIPIIGTHLNNLVSPASAAALGIGAIGTAIAASVLKVGDLERELRPLLERSGLTATSLQILEQVATRLGSEDGLEGVTDSVQELQLRLSELELLGTGPAGDALDQLGLDAQALKDSTPEQAFLNVITALQNLDSEYDKKFLADELMGGSSEKLSGIINASSLEFRALADEVARYGDIVDQDALDAARELDDEMVKLKDSAGNLQNELASLLIPQINNLIDGVKIASSDTIGGFKFLGSSAETGLGMIVDEYNEGIATLPWFSEIDFAGFKLNMDNSGQASLDFGDDVGQSLDDVDQAFLDTGDGTVEFKDKSNTALNGEGGAAAGIRQFSEEGRKALDELKEQWRINSEKATAGSMVNYAAETTDGILGESERKLTQLEIYRNNLEAARKKHHEETSLPNEKARAEAEADETTKAWQQVEKGFGAADDPESFAGKMTELRTAYFTKALNDLGDAKENTGYLGTLTSSYADAYDIIESDVTGAMDVVHQSLVGPDGHFTKIEEATGIHLSNIQAMYAMTGTAVTASWTTMMTNLTTEVDKFISGVSSGGYTPSTLFSKNRGRSNVRTKDLSELEDTSYGFRVKRDSAGEYYKFHSGYWVHEDDYNDFATWMEKQGEERTGGGTSPSSGGMSDFSLSYDSQGNYVGAGRGTHDITGNDANNQKTGVNASSRENLGLSPVGSTPPTLPGLPGFADGGIAMRPMAANIAESGPEAIIPLQKVGGTTVNVIFGEGAVLANDAVEFVLDALHEADLGGFR